MVKNVISWLLFVFYAAVPPSYSDTPQMNNAIFNGNTGELTCPMELGNLHTVLDPYDISWKQIFDGRLPEAVTDQNLLSNDNTILSIPINSSTASNVYQCELQLKRCDVVYPVSGPKCQSLLYTGPLMGFDVFGELIIILHACFGSLFVCTLLKWWLAPMVL